MAYEEDEKLDEIHALIKKLYGNCTSVTIFVNCEGLTAQPVTKRGLTECSMRTIDGNWIRRG
jgi:hypothetical protein